MLAYESYLKFETKKIRPGRSRGGWFSEEADS